MAHIIYKGALLLVKYNRNGCFKAIAEKDFDMDTEEFYPLCAAETEVKGLSTIFIPGESIPCRNSICTIEVITNNPAPQIITDLSEFAGCKLVDIRMHLSDGSSIDLSTWETLDVNGDGHVEATDFKKGLVLWEDGSYVRTIWGQKTKLEVVGFSEVELMEESYA